MERSTADTKERSPVSHLVESLRLSLTTVSLEVFRAFVFILALRRFANSSHRAMVAPSRVTPAKVTLGYFFVSLTAEELT